MSIAEYISQQKDIQKSLLEYVDHEINDKTYYNNLIKKLDDSSIKKDRFELSTTLRLIANVSNNHHRSPDFLSKFEQLILFFKEEIKQTFTNSQIFKTFHKNKQLLLFLIKEKILIPDKSFVEKISVDDYKNDFYPIFFYPEIQSLMDEKLLQEVDLKIKEINKSGSNAFEQFRKIGENQAQFCQLIRNDSLDEFISYVKSNNLNLATAIEPSVFETNPFLINKIPTLIEYAAFFGSLKVFNYLLENNVQLTGSVWIYAIHSQSMELIHLLEQKNVLPQDQSFIECFIEAIKCHHNEIADYIKNNLIHDKKENDFVNSQAIAVRNYCYFPEDLRNSNEFYDLCKYNYYKIVDFLLTNVADIDCNARVVLNVTALHIAVETGNDEIFKLLLAHKQIEIGEGAFYGCSQLKQITIPETVTIIGDNAFKFCSSLQSITIPETVTEIGDNAFRGCTSLQKIILPNSILIIGNNAFEGCNILQEIVVPSSVTAIGAYTFKNCSALQKVEFPNSLKSIGSYAFQGCSSLSQISLPDSVSILGAYSFEGCVSLKEVHFSKAIETISNVAFQGCTSLINIKLPESTKVVGRFAFRGCSSAKNIEFGSNIVSILDHSFKGCSSVENIVIPNSVKQIGDNSFEGCTSLKRIQLSSSLASLGRFLFRGCKLLTDVTIPNSVITIGSDAFSGCQSITKIEIPSSTTSIGNYAFEGCILLNQISIPPSVKSLGGYAFRGCIALNELTIPPSITSIEVATFEDCSKLEKITLPSTVNEIQADAFKGCTALKNLAIPSTVESIDNLGIEKSVQVTRF